MKKKLLLSLFALTAFSSIPYKAQAISGGAAAGIGVGAFFGGLVLAKAMCCCSSKKSNNDGEVKTSRRSSRKTQAA